jgi:sugar/nucleoside kinase (ribokinase family)
VSLLVVGSVAYDALESPYGKVERTLGGAATYFAVSAAFFTHVNLGAIVGDDFHSKDEGILRKRSIDIEGLERAPGKCFFWAGRYSENLNERVTLATDLNVFAEFKPRLPEKYRNCKYVFLANIAPDLQRDVLHQVKGTPKLAAMDTMNYWIERTNSELRETLKHVDILMINDSETRQLSSEHNLLRAARHIFKMGPTTLVVKRGEYGAMLVDKHGVFCVPAFPLEEPHDPTGAGDSFAGGFMGALTASGSISDASLRRAMIYGSVMGSFAVEHFGLGRLRRLTKKQITARARQFRHLTHFEL